MTDLEPQNADVESLCLAFYDISQCLESAADSETRVARVLERLRSVVHYEGCAVLLVLPGIEARLIAAPGTHVGDRVELLTTTTALMSRLVAEPQQAHESAATGDNHLAVPLVGLDDVIGILFVRDGAHPYDERHVRRLSVVAASLAAYFSMLRALVVQTERTVQLETAHLAADSANRVKDEFLAIVSHELRTPLGSILGWADTLRSQNLPEAERTRAVQAIERSVRTEVKLIEDLLDLSSIKSGELRLALETVDPLPLTEAAVRSLAKRAQQKSMRVETTLDPGVPPILVDTQRFNQIVVNLVANAIKFTPEGGRVEVRLVRAGSNARLQVIDDGAGISPELLPALFQRFRQADSSSTRPHGGLGVGLSLVKDLVELLGGTVEVESPGKGRGATFTVDLPLAAPPGSADSSGRPKQARAGHALSGIRVLLVDDDRDIGEVLQYVLAAQGALVTVATSAAEARTALALSMPTVLLSDLSMPGETGHDLMRQIVAREGSRAPPAAALSGDARGRDREQALASGFRMLLEKPIDADELVAAVAALAQMAAPDPTRSTFGGREP
jgi:signal transduction histidine kinase/ActR/RegA family two-component response regulator